MKNEQILKKAINKAIKNGWDICPKNARWYIDGEHRADWLCIDYGDGGAENQYSINDVIFSHDFAEAFWGEGEPVMIDGQEFYKFDWINWLGEEMRDAHCLPAWQYHLQQMVLKKEPLKYIERFL